MANKRRPEVREKDLQGLKYFDRLFPLLDRLHEVGTVRDKAGNRELFYDQYALLILLFFLNPIITSLRGLQQASGLAKVQKLLGVSRVSLGAFSEAAGVFDAEPLRNIVQELAQRAMPLQHGRETEALRGLQAVDGSLLPALPRMVWALWQDDTHHAAKLHLQFDVLKGVPADATITVGASSEPDQLRVLLQPGHLYVIDRGYAGYQLYHDIIAAGSSFVGRVKDNTAFTVTEERIVSAEARAAGVLRDVVVRLGTDRHKDSIGQNVRLVIVRRTKPDGSTEDLWLATDRLDLPAELVGLAYHYRWTIELFFRWFKRVLGCRHLLSECQNGLAIQCYVGLIASLLIVLWTGRKPTKRTWEMIQFYLIGWATLDELEKHIANLPEPTQP
jgi:Transposase DDE domain